VSDAPPAAGNDDAAHDGDAARVQTAKRLRGDHPRWVIIWAAPTRRYCAYPLFRTRRDLKVSAAEPADLVAQIHSVEQAAPSSRPRSRPAS
jgi:hypothetical protein